MCKLLAVDLDGTLFYPKSKKRCISKKNVKFLQDWIDAGNKVVLVTSRSKQFVERLKPEIERPFDVITCSSSQIWANDELIRDVPMEKNSLKDVFKFLNETQRPTAYLLTTDKYPCLIKQNNSIKSIHLWLYHQYWKHQGKLQEPFVIDSKLFDKEIEEGKSYKVMVFYGLGRDKKKISKELNKLLREKHPDIESSWSIIVNELTPKGCNKAVGVEYYCNYFHIDEDDVIVVGDSGNDISMFNRFHEHSFVMSHAYPSVKKYAKYTISRVFKLRKFVLKGEQK